MEGSWQKKSARDRAGSNRGSKGSNKMIGIIPAAVALEDPTDLGDLPGTCLESLGFG